MLLKEERAAMMLDLKQPWKTERNKDIFNPVV
jgi:hypothetical protein